MGFTGRNIKIFPSVLLLVAVILTSLNITAFANAEAQGVGMAALLHEDGEKLNITWGQDIAQTPNNVFLMMVSPNGTRSVVCGNIDVSLKKATVDLKNTEYLYSGFYLCDDSGASLTSCAYVTNPDVLGKHSPYPEVTSKKGLNIRLIADAQQLGVCHTVLDVELNRLISDGSQTAENAVIDEKKYFFDAGYVNSLDHKIKVLSDSGINVYLQIVLTSPQKDISQAASKLYFDARSEEAEYYAVNTSDGGSEYLFASLYFLASRYAVHSDKYGFAGSYIIGNCVNSNRCGNFAGEKNHTDYVNEYANTFRIAYAALKSAYSNSRVYVCINDNFNTPVDIEQAPDSNLDYAGRDFLQSFNFEILQGGNIDWSLCTEIYNINRLTPCFWNEKEAINDISTPYITMKNIGVLTDMLSKEEFLYNSEKRRVTISSCAFSAGRNTPSEQALQASAYALAYYVSEANGMIDAFIYDSHVDLVSDECANSGLFTRREDSLQLTNEKKEIYNVFQSIDTAASLQITEKYLKILNISSYEEYISTHNAMQEKRVIISNIACQNVDHPSVVSFDFKNGVCGFYPSDNAKSAISETISKKGYLTCETYNSDICEYRGVCRMLSELDLSKAGYITFDINTQAPKNVQYVDVMVRLWGNDITGKTIIYEGVSQISVENTVQLTYNISEFLSSCGNNAKGMKIWIKPHTDRDGGDYTVQLSNVAFLNKNPSYTAFIVAFCIMAVLLCVFLCVYKFKNNHKKSNVFLKNNISAKFDEEFYEGK